MTLEAGEKFFSNLFFKLFRCENGMGPHGTDSGDPFVGSPRGSGGSGSRAEQDGPEWVAAGHQRATPLPFPDAPILHLGRPDRMIQGASDFLNGVVYSGNGRLILSKNWIPSFGSENSFFWFHNDVVLHGASHRDEMVPL